MLQQIRQVVNYILVDFDSFLERGNFVCIIYSCKNIRELVFEFVLWKKKKKKMFKDWKYWSQ